MTQIEIIAFIAQTALTFIFVQVATSNASKQTTTDHKTDLRTTKEDLFAELKDTRETLLLDEIIKREELINSDKYWRSDEFAEQGIVVEACILKAQEARAELNRKKAEEFDAYYSAYCD